MYDMNTPPQLRIVCPVPWQTMTAAERSRFCQQCRRDIPNLSLLSRTEREEVYHNAKTESVCAAFLTHVSGEMATPQSLAVHPKWRVLQKGAASAALGVLVVSGGCATLKEEAGPPAAEQQPLSVQQEPTTEDLPIVFLAFGEIIDPQAQPIEPRKAPSRRKHK